MNSIDERQARRIAHDLWPTESLSGQLNQELPMPAHFEQVAALVTEDMVAEGVPCGADPERYIKVILAYRQAGFDEIYINQFGPGQHGFLEFYNKQLRPSLET